MGPAGASSGDHVTFVPAWVGRHLSPFRVRIGGIAWSALWCAYTLLLLGHLTGVVPDAPFYVIVSLILGVLMVIFLCAAIMFYVLAVRFALLHPSTRHSRGVHLSIAGSVLALCWVAGALLSLFIPALSAIRSAVGAGLLILAVLLPLARRGARPDSRVMILSTC